MNAFITWYYIYLPTLYLGSPTFLILLYEANRGANSSSLQTDSLEVQHPTRIWPFTIWLYYHSTIWPYYYITIMTMSLYDHITIWPYYYITILPYNHIIIWLYDHSTILPYNHMNISLYYYMWPYYYNTILPNITKSYHWLTNIAKY